MLSVQRYDYLEASATAQPETTPEGFLKVMVRATRSGVLKYKRADGSILRELRHPDEVFKPASMASLALKPMTNNHPSSLLDSKSAAMHITGMTGETVKVVDGKYLEVLCVITDRDAIADAEKGKVEVSPGYVCELDFTPGVYDGEEYDAVQRNIRYNHLAQVKKGRSGPEVCLRLDEADGLDVSLNQQKENKTMKVKFGKKEYEVADDVGQAMMDEMESMKDKSKEEMDAFELAKKKSEKEKADAMKEKEKAEAKADGLEAEIKNLKAQHTDAADPVKLREAVKARLALDKVAQMAKIEKFDEMSDLDLKKAVILVGSPDVKLDGKSEDYISARFDVAAESILSSDQSAKDLGKKLIDGKETAGKEVMDSDSARQKMIERQQGQWKSTEKKGE